ncbi:MAG: ATP-binding cassette domain-containing protein, partial [Eudoraea sp.]|nr:ATP-binding cassette domain-containing protein [Eudoraea sp.]NNJ41339.1 ATP-binding cassette domain-containing protein [Eudoraea sp.]
MKNLHIDSITKSYNNKPILSDVFLSCNIGEIVGILGRNGCGKSTLLKIVYAVETSENRFVRIGDKIIKRVTDTKNIISFLPQDGFLPKGVKISTLIKCFLPQENRALLYGNEFLQPYL